MFKNLLTLIFALICVGGLVAQPANDDCANAISIALNEVVAYTTIDATNVGPVVIGCGGFTPAENDSIPADIWFTYTATADGVLGWTNCGSDFDSRMAVYATSDPCLAGNDNLVNCNDDGSAADCPNSGSDLVFIAEAGTTYTLRLGGFANEETPSTSGSGDVTLRVVNVPANDQCQNAIELFVGADQPFTTEGALTDGPDHDNTTGCFGFNSLTVGQDVWYTFTPPSDGTYQWTTCGTINYDSRLAVYAPGAACPPDAGDLLFCNDDGAGADCPSGQFHSDLFFEGEAGETYILRLGGFGTEEGAGTFSLINNSPPPAPSNDLCMNAEPTAILSQEVADNFDDQTEGSTLGATFDPLDYPLPFCLGNQDGGEFADVWYSVQSLANESIEIRIFPAGQGQNPATDFFIDVFSDCSTQLDTLLVPQSCTGTTVDNPFGVVEMTGLPVEDIPLLIRVSTRVTGSTPGEFAFQLVGENATSSVNDYIVAEQLEVYPNPSTTQLNVRFALEEAKTIQADVYDLLGRRVISQQQGQLLSGTQQFELQTGDLAAGVYNLRLTDGKGQQQVKFVVQ